MKKIHRNQSGVAALTIIGLILIFAVVGFTGWRVWEARKDAKKQLESGSSQQATKTEPKNEESKVPEGYTLYENKDLGFKFSYPKEWGEAKTSAGPETGHLIKGSEFTISFTKNDNVTAGVVSKDWKHDPNLGHGGQVYAGAYSGISYAELTKYGGTTTQQKDDMSFIVSQGISGVSCIGAGNILVHSLDGNKTYPAIAFLYFDKKNSGQTSPEEAICEKYKEYISQAHVDELKKISTTIEVL
jgi:hypothetical protein